MSALFDGIPSLYVHFPFCETKCHYCDFYSLGKERTSPEDAGLFEKALEIEAKKISQALGPKLETLFFGGGTPSMTPAGTMERALRPIWEKCTLSDGYEWTLEANPSSVNLDSLKEYRSLGVNRISMGVQATRDSFLSKLGRIHNRDTANQALENIFVAGFTNVSVDLLCGIPGQNLEDLDESMSLLLSYPITHLSCYLLTLPKHHRMAPELPNEEAQLSHLLFIDEKLNQNGFVHYEISNFAKPGKQARHNLNYWNGGSYLGMGPSAHSFDSNNKRRRKNVSSLHRYAELLNLGQSPVEWEESLSHEQYQLEKWMLALRLSEGFPTHWLDTPSRIQKARELEKLGLLEDHPSNTLKKRLTPRGFALSDQIIASLS